MRGNHASVDDGKNPHKNRHPHFHSKAHSPVTGDGVGDRSVRINDKKCIETPRHETPRALAWGRKGAPRVREGQLERHGRTNGWTGRRREVSVGIAKKLTFLVHARCMQAGWPRRRSFRAGKTACRPPQCVSFHRRRCGVQEGRRINALPDGS